MLITLLRTDRSENYTVFSADYISLYTGTMEREIKTDIIGERVMDRLRSVDQVAYVRFASVYRQFKDIDTFMAELTKLLAET